MNRAIENKVTIAFAAAILALVVAAALAWSSMRASLATSQDLHRTHEVLAAHNHALAALNDAVAAARAYVIDGAAARLVERDAATSEFRSQLQDLVELTAGDAAQQERLKDLEAHSLERMDLISAVMVARQTKGFEAARTLLAQPRGDELLREIRATLRDFEAAEQLRLAEREAADAANRERVVVFSAALLAIVIVTIALGLQRLLLELRISREAHARIDSLNEALTQKARALEAANQELESFSYSVSHDLRAPLRAIDGFSRMLEEDFGADLAPEARRYISVIREATQKMGRLIEDLLAFSRLTRTPIHRHPVDTKALVARAAEEVLGQHAGGAPELVLGELPATHGDPALLHQVWVNLLGNAVKYSAKVAAPRIEVGGRADERETTFYVKDNGAGFDMRYVDKLFGVFQRLHRDDEFPGTGVGLAIVQRVIGRHGGRIWAQSEPDRGAHFFFTLPREAA